MVFETAYGDSRQLISWVLGLGPRARILEPPELVEEAEERVRPVVERHSEPIELADPAPSAARARPTRTTASARARSAPSASPGWSRWPAS